jgi:hypothetical protein
MPDLGITEEGMLGMIEQLRGGAKIRLPYQQIHLVLGMLIKAADRLNVYQSYSIPDDHSIVRARHLEKAGEWFQSIADLGPLQPEKTLKYGRCHRPGRSVAYCSLHESIALTEIRAELGQQYVLSTFSMPTGSVVLPVGELDYFRRTGETYLGEALERSKQNYKKILDREDWAVIALFDAFLADEFITSAETQVDYKVTSAMAEIMFHGDLQFGEPIDAIIYPSVAFRAGTNFAVKSSSFHPSKVRLVESETKIIEVTKALGYGIHEYRVLTRLKSVKGDGRLEWF